MSDEQLSPELWIQAWIHFEGKALIQCGNGIHPVNEKCVKCFNKR